MWPDGICRVTDTRYTKTIQYQDINYQLSQNEDKTAIFESWCDFLNYFDSSVQFQLSFVNLSASQETFARSITIPPCGDEFDAIRAEYAEMLQNQLARGNNGLIKTKYLTFGTEAAFEDGCYLLFGKETKGLPEDFLEAHREACVRIPMRSAARSLNLSNAVAITVFEALRQLDFPQLLEFGKMGADTPHTMEELL